MYTRRRKRRRLLLSFVVTICLLVSVAVMAAFAASGYKIHVPGWAVSSSKSESTLNGAVIVSEMANHEDGIYASIIKLEDPEMCMLLVRVEDRVGHPQYYGSEVIPCSEAGGSKTYYDSVTRW